jgi:type IV secretion system protein VirD4
MSLWQWLLLPFVPLAMFVVLVLLLTWAFDKPPEPITAPEASGVHGSQGLSWTAADLKATGLLGPNEGEGIRAGACWETGEPLRYAGPDAESSIIGIGPSGLGKGVSFQIPALMEFGGSSGTVDPSGQLFMTTAPELQRRGVRLIPVIPFAEGFPPELGALVKQSRCINPMDALDPQSESFAGDCGELGQLLKAEEKGTGGDPFFKLSGGNLKTMLIACVKLYSHASEQNLCEVFHKLGDVFTYARSIITKPGLPRFIATPLKRWAAPGAEMNKTLLSIVETALSELSWLGDEAIERVLRTSSFSWDDLKNGARPLAVFFLLPVNKLESHKAFLTLCTGAALMGLGKTGRGRHTVLLTIDEAALLGYMPMLQRAFAESRKRGVQLSVWYQNIHQASAIYGPAWMNQLSGSDLQIHLRPRDLASAEFISSQIGNYTEVIPHVSYGPGRGGHMQESWSFQEQGRPVMFPQEIMALPPGPNGCGNAAIMIAPGRSRHALQIWARPWFDCPDLKDKGGIDAYHRHRSTSGGNAE